MFKLKLQTLLYLSNILPMFSINASELSEEISEFPLVKVAYDT